jgi:hypothetical protein
MKSLSSESFNAITMRNCDTERFRVLAGFYRSCPLAICDLCMS